MGTGHFEGKKPQEVPSELLRFHPSVFTGQADAGIAAGGGSHDRIDVSGRRAAVTRVQCLRGAEAAQMARNYGRCQTGWSIRGGSATVG